MQKRFTDDFVDNCIELNKSGLYLSEIAKRFSCSSGHLSVAMKQRGYNIFVQQIKANFPEQETIKLYSEGWSVKKLSEKFGVSRGVISKYLKKQGIQPRNRSEAMFNRMKFTTEEERKNLAKAANEAVRGRAAKRERLIKGSITRISNNKFVGFGEEMLQSALTKIGLEVIPQFAFDIYNIDLIVNRNITVEVKIGMTNPLRIKKHRVKTEKLLNSGFNVIWVCASSQESFMANLSNLVTYFNEISRDPAFIGQNRVIRCYFNSAHRQNEFGQFTTELAFKEPKMDIRTDDFHVSG